MRYHIILILAVLLIFISSICHAISGKDNPDLYLKFDEASSLYSESRFQESLRLYESILESGYESAPLYYNIGNSYIKTGNLGKAILYYERAMQLAPYDSDLRANTRYANSIKREPVAALTASSWISRRTNAMLSILTVDGLARFLSAIYIAALLVLGTGVFISNFMKFSRRLAIVLAVIFMIFFTILSLKIYQTEHIESAIVFDATADARYEPLSEAPVHFRLYEGSKIIVLRTRGEWSQVKRDDNKIGWIKSDVYGMINIK